MGWLDQGRKAQIDALTRAKQRVDEETFAKALNRLLESKHSSITGGSSMASGITHWRYPEREKPDEETTVGEKMQRDLSLGAASLLTRFVKPTEWQVIAKYPERAEKVLRTSEELALPRTDFDWLSFYQHVQRKDSKRGRMILLEVVYEAYKHDLEQLEASLSQLRCGQRLLAPGTVRVYTPPQSVPEVEADLGNQQNPFQLDSPVAKNKTPEPMQLDGSAVTLGTQRSVPQANMDISLGLSMMEPTNLVEAQPQQHQPQALGPAVNSTDWDRALSSQLLQAQGQPQPQFELPNVHPGPYMAPVPVGWPDLAPFSSDSVHSIPYDLTALSQPMMWNSALALTGFPDSTGTGSEDWHLV